jgi:PrtD family type I secretion system ABC transporter
VKKSRKQKLTTPLTHALAATKRHFVSAAIFSAMVNLLFLGPTLYMLQIYDRVVPTGSGVTLLFITLALLLALATLALLDMVRARLLVRAGVRLDRQLSGAVLDATLRRSPGQGLSRQTMRDLDALRQTLTGAGIIALFDAPWTPIYIIVCFLIHPALGAMAFVGAVLLVLIAWRNAVATRGPMTRANEAANQGYVSQESSIAASDVIRAMGMRTATVRRHLNEREEMAGLQTDASFASSGYSTLSRFVRLALQSLGLGMGAWLAIDNLISAGAIFAASFLMARALAPIDQMLGAWQGIQRARGAYRNLVELFADDEPFEASRTQLPPPTGKLSVEGLTVLNPRRDGTILRDITFAMEAGEIVGIVGPSGAGKSTLARMIAGAAVADRGAVRFDGAERSDWDPERLGKHIGFMPQEPTLFAGTIKSNICRFADFDLDDPASVDAAVIEAAQGAGAHEMILRFPQGYDTELGFGGRGLSAGQAQRIALARALYGNPNLLILDEPNAHLDAEGEAGLLDTLAAVKARGASALVIAHRSGILAALDKLMLLRDGSIEIYGTRDHVLSRISGAGKPRVASPQSSEARTLEQGAGSETS